MMASIPTSFGRGRFIVEQELGRGNMGVVYRAFDQEHNITVALKTLMNMDAGSLYYFKREFRALHDIIHPNLCAFMELIQGENSWFLTMELIDGINFGSYLKCDAHLDERKLRKCFAGLCEGLNALHAAGKVHRDIKPSNVMIAKSERVVLLDFGLITEREIQRTTELNAIVGTAEYMAPEQTESSALGPEADWYAVGVMLFESLTGDLPFQGQPMKVILDKQMEDPPKPSDLRSDVPSDLDELCFSLLSRDPRLRPNPSEFLRSVDAYNVSLFPKQQPHFSAHNLGEVIVGRSAELRLLEESYERALNGSFEIVVIEGVSGVGKSILVDNFLNDVRSADNAAVILGGRCYENESAPYKAFDGIIESLIRYLANVTSEVSLELLPRHADLLIRLFPSLRRHSLFANIPLAKIEIDDPHQVQRRAFTAFGDHLTRLCRQHPVVVVIDDMQWADTDSLSLLRHIGAERISPMFLILVSRFADEAKDSVWGWNEITEKNVKSIHLQPLSERDAALLAQLYIEQYKNTIDVAPELIAVESGGHPLYIAEIVQHFANNEVEHWNNLRLDEVIWDRVQSLPLGAQKVLKIICIAGTPIVRRHLQKLSELNYEEFYKTMFLLRSAKLIRSRGPRSSDLVEPYHDRVRESVAGHVKSSGEDASIHSSIALFYLSTYTEEEIEEHIFTILQHLQASRHFFSRPADVKRLVGLYLIAGRKAREISAFAVSLAYLEAAIADLSEGAWDADYQLTLELHEEAARAAHLTADAQKVVELTDTIFEHTQHVLHDVKATEVRILSLFSENKNVEVAEFGMAFLKRLGLSLSVNPGKLSLATALFRIKMSLVDKTDEDIFHLLPMTDEYKLAVMRVLSAMSLSLYSTNKNLYALSIFTQMRLVITWGHSAYSSSTLSSYGLILCGKLGDIEGGYRFGKLGLELMKAYSEGARVSRVQAIANGFIFPNKINVALTGAELRKTYKLGVASGDFQYSNMAIGQYINQMLTFGIVDLQQLVAETRSYILEIKRMRQDFWWLFMVIHLQMILKLVEDGPDRFVLDGEKVTEQQLLEISRKEQNETCELLIYVLKMGLHCLFGEFEGGIQWCQKARPLYHAATGTATMPVVMVMEALIYLRGTRNWRSATGRLRQRLVKQIRNELKTRAKYAPANYLHYLKVIDAEQYRQQGKDSRAAPLYEEAIGLAASNGHLNAEAMVNELAAQFYLSRGDRHTATTFVINSRLAYRRWGAKAKVSQLEEKYAGLLDG